MTGCLRMQHPKQLIANRPRGQQLVELPSTTGPLETTIQHPVSNLQGDPLHHVHFNFSTVRKEFLPRRRYQTYPSYPFAVSIVDLSGAEGCTSSIAFARWRQCALVEGHGGDAPYGKLLWPLVIIFGHAELHSRTDSQALPAEYCIVGIPHNTAI